MLMNDSQVQTLVEALPYLSKFKNKTSVVKYGGNAMLNDALKNKVLQDIVFLQCAGMRPVVVHGGGPEITRMLAQAGKKTEFVSGLRVTDEESVGIAEMARLRSIWLMYMKMARLIWLILAMWAMLRRLILS